MWPSESRKMESEKYESGPVAATEPRLIAKVGSHWSLTGRLCARRPARGEFRRPEFEAVACGELSE